jgi:uncharacterized coiled-coil protein SlyX
MVQDIGYEKSIKLKNGNELKKNRARLKLLNNKLKQLDRELYYQAICKVKPGLKKGGYDEMVKNEEIISKEDLEKVDAKIKKTLTEYNDVIVERFKLGQKL